MRSAFSLTELVIVAAIIGILAALAIPYFQSETMEAKEAAAKDNLRLLRGAIELYAARHAGVLPGYTGGTPSGDLDAICFVRQIVYDDAWLRRMPENPYNHLDTILMIGNGEPFPTKATGKYGWIYQPATKTMCLDWPGSDPDGVRYMDY